jgi:hypothetical protein
MRHAQMFAYSFLSDGGRRYRLATRERLQRTPRNFSELGNNSGTIKGLCLQSVPLVEIQSAMNPTIIKPTSTMPAISLASPIAKAYPGIPS